MSPSGADQEFEMHSNDPEPSAPSIQPELDARGRAAGL